MKKYELVHDILISLLNRSEGMRLRLYIAPAGLQGCYWRFLKLRNYYDYMSIRMNVKVICVDKVVSMGILGRRFLEVIK